MNSTFAIVVGSFLVYTSCNHDRVPYKDFLNPSTTKLEAIVLKFEEAELIEKFTQKMKNHFFDTTKLKKYIGSFVRNDKPHTCAKYGQIITKPHTIALVICVRNPWNYSQ